MRKYVDIQLVKLHIMIVSSLVLQEQQYGGHMYTTVVGENKYIIVQGVDMREMRQTAPPSSPPHPTSIRSEAPTYSSGEGGYLP